MAGRILISFITLLLFAGEAWADVVVIVRREAEAGGNYVRVCDIARVEGPREQAAEVGRIVLGPTPTRGMVKEFTRWDIESRLFEMGVTAPVVFSGNDTVTVVGGGSARRAAPHYDAELSPLNPMPHAGALALDIGSEAPALVPPAVVTPTREAKQKKTDAPARRTALDAMSPQAKVRIGKTVAAFLAAQYQRRDVEVEASVLAISEAIPYDAADVTVLEAIDGKVPGKARLRLTVREDAESEPRQVTVSADTQVYGLALVASRKLPRGTVLGKRDVRVQRVRMESGKGYFPPKPAAVEGRELRVALESGSPVIAGETEMVEAVKRGDKVVIDTIGHGWQVQGLGIALENGMIGDLITVQDSNTKVKIPTRITGMKKVEVLNNTNR